MLSIVLGVNTVMTMESKPHSTAVMIKNSLKFDFIVYLSKGLLIIRFASIVIAHEVFLKAVFDLTYKLNLPLA